MAYVSGPALEGMAEELREWLVDITDWLYEEITDDHPYGAVRLSATDQLIRWREMQADPSMWREFILNLEERYKGMPNKRERVQRDIDVYARKMQALEARQGGQA